MAKLTKDQKEFIVRELACWRSPSEVAEGVVERWPELDGKIDRRQVFEYNPDRSAGKRLEALFDATREAFISEIGRLGIAHQSWRLREILETVGRAKRMGNEKLKLEALEQAAKELGGAFTNSKRLQHSGSIATPTLEVVVKRSDEAGEG